MSKIHSMYLYFLVVDDETEKEISIEEMPVVEASKIPIQVKGIMLS